MKKTYRAEIGPCGGVGHPVLKPPRGGQLHFDYPFDAWLTVQPQWEKNGRIKLIFTHTKPARAAHQIRIRRSGVYLGEVKAHGGYPCVDWRRFFAYWKWVRFA